MLDEELSKRFEVRFDKKMFNRKIQRKQKRMDQKQQKIRHQLARKAVCDLCIVFFLSFSILKGMVH